MGTKKTGVAGNEVANALLVAKFECGLEVGRVQVLAGWRRNFLVVAASKPVFSIIASVIVITVMSGIGTWPNVATHWMWEILAQRSLIVGSSMFHGSERAARLLSSSLGVMAPYSARRWASISHGEISLKPTLRSSKALRKDELTAVRIWAVRAALMRWYNVILAIA